MSSFGSSDSSFVESIGKNKYFKAPGIKYHADGDIVRLPEWDLLVRDALEAFNPRELDIYMDVDGLDAYGSAAQQELAAYARHELERHGAEAP